MPHANRITLRDERREMQRLMLERGKHNPIRNEPDWVLDFWVERRRMLT